MGLIDSFEATIGRSEAEAAKDNPGRIVVGLDGFRDADSARRIVEGAKGVAVAEPQLSLPARISARDAASFDGALTLLSFRSEIWAPTITEGSAPAEGRPEAVISEKAASDLGVGVGDSITLVFPRREAGGFVDTRARIRVSGLHPNPFRVFVYMDASAAALAGAGGIANQVSATPEPGVGVDRIARALFGVPAVASVEEATATAKLVRERLDDFVGALRLIEVFALALALLIAFNSSAIGIDERRRENATMLAFGVTGRRTMAVAVGESLIAGLLGTLVGLAGGYLVTSWVVDRTLPETVPDLGLVVELAPASLLAAGLVGVAAVSLAPLLSARRIRRMDVPSTLRVME
jgi:putative ABC transport system permease protein